MLLFVSGDFRCSYRVNRVIPASVLLFYGHRVEDDGEVAFLVTKEAKMASRVSIVR